ncbi:MAG: YhgE/Pip domain-containing protein [Clostridia bacterium]|nr:YhgE/Pip domain-containing protein [Clostridia bacterium]
MKKLLQEHKAFKIIIIAVVLLIPVIYSFFYLKAYWDPYGNLQDVSVAMVNLDKGSRGSELIKNMQEAENTLGFTEVSADEAIKGLGEDKYYAVITIPEDFTTSLESAKEEEKQKAVITFTPNKRKNYLSYQIINSGLKTAEMQLQSKVSAEVAGTMSDKLKEVPDSLDKIVDGVDQIYDGSGRLTDGLGELSEGVNTLDTKYTEFDDGIKSADEGSKKLTDGLSQSSEGTKKLAEGSSSLDDGVKQINEALENADTSKITDLTNGIEQLNEGVNGSSGLVNGLNTYIDGVHTYEDKIESGAKLLESGLSQYIAGQNTLSDKQDQVLQGLVGYIKANPSLQSDPVLKQLADSSESILSAKQSSGLDTYETLLKSGASSLANAKETNEFKQLEQGEQLLKGGANKVGEGVTQLKNSNPQIMSLGNSLGLLKYNLNKVQDGTSQLKNGVETLQSGTSQLESGANTLSNGLGQLSTNSSIIKTSLVKLDDGAKSALDGSKQITEGLDTLKSSVEEGKDTASEQITKLDGIKDFVEDPVEFKEESFGEVASYGVAFTPLFLSIGLWVGALMLYVVLYYDQRHRFGILDHENKNKILQNCIYLGIGVIEGLATGIILKALLGFEVANMGTYLFECILTGMTFTMIMQFLIRNFGDIGKFLSLIILVLQLAASGGTFPVETIDQGFQGFTSWLPMTYSVRIFKDCLVETNSNLIGGNTAVLVGILIALFILNLIIEKIKLNMQELESEQ